VIVVMKVMGVVMAVLMTVFIAVFVIVAVPLAHLRSLVPQSSPPYRRKGYHLKDNVAPIQRILPKANIVHFQVFNQAMRLCRRDYQRAEGDPGPWSDICSLRGNLGGPPDPGVILFEL